MNSVKFKMDVSFIKCSLETPFCFDNFEISSINGMVLCYQGMLSNMGNENYKPAVRFEVNKTEGNIVDYFCQICVHKGICSGDDVDLRGIIIFYDKSTKVAEMYSSIFERELMLEKIQEINELLQFFVDNQKINKKILFSIPADKTLTNSMKTNPVAYLNDYPGIFALKMDMLLGKTENKLTNKKNIVGVGLLQKALVPATTTLQPFHPTPYLYQTSNTHNIQETSNTPTSKYTTPKSECIFKLNPREYNGYGCFCGVGKSGEALDEIDKCCQKHDTCRTNSKSKCSESMTQFDIFSDSMLLSNYQWECVKDTKIGCLNSENDECRQKLCNCDKELIECLSKQTKPKEPLPCWSKIDEEVNEAAREPIKAIKSICEEVIVANESVSNYHEEYMNNGDIKDKENAMAAVKRAAKANKDLLALSKKIRKSNKEKLEKVNKNLDAAIKKAKKTNSLVDHKAVDDAIVETSKTVMAVLKVREELDKALIKGFKSIKMRHELFLILSQQEP
ncbi:hypothetical protein ACQ4LE_002462 [Meloidogyne hapla]